MVSSRDRRFVSVEMVWLGPSPGRRRLRFSFQINDVKDPTGFRRPHRLAPGGGGGGYLVASEFRVNRPFPAFLRRREPPKFGARNARGRRGASPIQSVAIRLKSGKLVAFEEKIKRLSAPIRLLPAPVSRGAAYLVACFGGVNRPARLLTALRVAGRAVRTTAMLSQKARYALRALVELARAEGAQLTAGELALRADAPRKFLEAILLELARNRIVVSRRGKFGGYSLARAPETISFAEVIRVIDGPLALAPCVSRLSFRKCEDCPDLATCALREALLRARDATAQVLEGYSLADAAAGEGAEVFSAEG